MNRGINEGGIVWKISTNFIIKNVMYNSKHKILGDVKL